MAGKRLGPWVCEPNGAGGFQVVRRGATGFIARVASDHSFFRNAQQAVDRMTDNPAEWESYYRARDYPEPREKIGKGI